MSCECSKKIMNVFIDLITESAVKLIVNIQKSIEKSKYYYGKEIYRGYGMSSYPEKYKIFQIAKIDYDNKIAFDNLSSKIYIKTTGTYILTDEFFQQF